MRLSIVIPCYNVAGYLKKCLNSIFRNDCNDAEIILIDDGSTDSTNDILAQYFNQKNCDRNIDFSYENATVKIIHQKNKGVSSARNAGIEHATGDYIIFIDPDDTVDQDYFSSIKKVCSSEEVDIVIQGFYKTEEDKDGHVISETCIWPQQQYRSDSVKETVHNIFPKYLGYSIDDILKWAKSQSSLSNQLEWGAVWRNIYRLKFLNEHNIRFNPEIYLNEDSMFNATCFSMAEKVRTLNRAFYHYTIRSTGALLKNRGAKLLDNKMALLKERTRIIEILNQHNFDLSVRDYAGSNVLSCMELIIKMPFSARHDTKQYLQNPIVKQSVRQMPLTGIKKMDIPLWMLKHNMGMVALYAVKVIEIFGVSFHL